MNRIHIAAPLVDVFDRAVSEGMDVVAAECGIKPAAMRRRFRAAGYPSVTAARNVRRDTETARTIVRTIEQVPDANTYELADACADAGWPVKRQYIVRRMAALGIPNARTRLDAEVRWYMTHTDLTPVQVLDSLRADGWRVTLYAVRTSMDRCASRVAAGVDVAAAAR